LALHFISAKATKNLATNLAALILYAKIILSKKIHC